MRSPAPNRTGCPLGPLRSCRFLQNGPAFASIGLRSADEVSTSAEDILVEVLCKFSGLGVAEEYRSAEAELDSFGNQQGRLHKKVLRRHRPERTFLASTSKRERSLRPIAKRSPREVGRRLATERRHPRGRTEVRSRGTKPISCEATNRFDSVVHWGSCCRFAQSARSSRVAVECYRDRKISSNTPRCCWLSPDHAAGSR